MGREPFIKHESLPDVKWQGGSYLLSLESVYEYLRNNTQNVIKWYVSARKWKRRFSRMCRFFAMIFAASAAIVPVVGSAVQWKGESPGLPYMAWGSNWQIDMNLVPAVMLALAAFLVALDKLMGFSETWMRYTLTEMEIRRRWNAFELGWQEQIIGLGASPSADQCKCVLVYAREFLEEINKLIRDETTKWIREFSTGIIAGDAVLDDSKRRKYGTIRVRVDNGRDIYVSLNGKFEEKCYGGVCVIAGVEPGIHRVLARGVIQNTPVSAQEAVVVRGDEITEVTLTLLLR